MPHPLWGWGTEVSSARPRQSTTMPPMSGQPEQPPMTPPPAKRASRWFPIALGAMVVLFIAVMLGRNHIRAHWWAYRLAAAEDASSQAYYLGAISSVGQSAQGAIDRLAKKDAPHLRAMAVVVLEASKGSWSIQILGRLLNDTDVDVRESAALAIGFMRTEPARAVLRKAIESNVDGAAAAVHALGRADGATARDLLCEVLTTHPSPAVRAQAVETLADTIRMEAAEPTKHDARDAGSCDPWLALAGLLADNDVFDGSLAIEREIAAAMAFASAGRPLDAATTSISLAKNRRTVGQIAAKQLSALSGEVIVPVVELAAGQQAEFAGRCRQAFLQRSNTAAGSLLPGDAEKPTSTPASSSDTSQDQS